MAPVDQEWVGHTLFVKRKAHINTQVVVASTRNGLPIISSEARHLSPKTATPAASQLLLPPL